MTYPSTDFVSIIHITAVSLTENTLSTRNVVATGIPYLVKIIRIIGGSKCTNVNSLHTGILVKSPNDISPLLKYQPSPMVKISTIEENAHKYTKGVFLFALKKVPKV